MAESNNFADSRFKLTLEKKLLELQYPLSDVERNKVETWKEILTETDESLKKRSSSRRNVRRRARYFARKVYAVNGSLFVLCSLSYTISGLPTIPPGGFL